jgi:hypothetical protein
MTEALNENEDLEEGSSAEAEGWGRKGKGKKVEGREYGTVEPALRRRV